MLQALTLQTYGFAPLTKWRRDLRKGVFTTQQSKQKYFDSTVKILKLSVCQSATQINSDGISS